MKVFKEVGSKERFLEMFQKVNKVRLNEAFGQGLNPQSVLEVSFSDLKNGTLPIEERKTETKGNLSYVQFICVDKQGNNITFTFKAQVQEGDQEGVFDITDVILDSFSFDSAGGDEELVEMKGDMLNQFNTQHKNEMFDIVDEDINVEQEEEIDTLYEDAVKKIDAVPYKGGSEKMQTHKAYADEKPTNASVRVDADELKKFVKEDATIPDTERIIDKTVIDGFNRLDPATKEKYINQAKQEVEEEMGIYLGGAQAPSNAHEKMIIARARGIYADEISKNNEGLNENEYPEQLGKEFKPESQGEYAKKTKAEKKRKSKKVKIKESTDRDRFENVVFLQGDEAYDALERLDREGEDAALEYLKQWHYPGEHEGASEEGHGTDDKVYRKDGYVMSWNPRIGYIGLQYDLSQMNEEKEEEENPELDVQVPQGEMNGENDGMSLEPDADTFAQEKQDTTGATSGKKGHHVNIESETTSNEDFRKVLYTGEHLQLVLMTLQANEEIGIETHDTIDQFFRFEAGTGKAIINGNEYEVVDGDSIIIPAGSEHNIINTGTEPLKMYTIYAPPNHQDGVQFKTKADAEGSDEKFDGKTTEGESGGNEEDKELSDVLLGYKAKNVGDEVNETIGYDEYKGLMGDKYADAEGNEFAVSNKVKGGVTLKGQGGEKEVATGDLDLMKKMDEMGESKESELKQNDPATWHQIQIAKKTLKMPDAMVGVMGGMTKEEAKEILRKNNVTKLQELAAGKKSKTFKIGEYAIGGIIQVDITGDAKVNIRALDWNTKQPVMGDVFAASDVRGMDNYLNELTSSFFAGKVMEWIEQNTGVDSRPNYFGNQNW
jgi:mannose-6-phosphate isomerase-like protein (cupin superfamily)